MEGPAFFRCFGSLSDGAREKANVLETSRCQSVQDIAVRMQHAKEKEKNDPINGVVEDDSDLCADVDSTSSEVKLVIE